MRDTERLAVIGGLAILIFLAVVTLVAAPAALDTLRGEAGHYYVDDLGSHLAMCDDLAGADRDDCIMTAYETWN